MGKNRIILNFLKPGLKLSGSRGSPRSEVTVPDYVSGKFRDMELTEMKEIGRDKIECKRFGPKLVHSVPDMKS